ncbi:MAG: glycine dehydrogenase subunit 2 [Candidatus Dadabacteria bacterium]|nr:MAG: glycine dehydrogenase subunit 2 [Candidatus Dadabacteria bacterium]
MSDFPGTTGLILEEPILFDLPGDPDAGLDPADVPEDLAEVPLRQAPLGLPNVAEYRVVRHYTRISQYNYGIESGLFPLGSCTMKHNPRVNELLAALDGFAWLHPEAPEQWSQGALQVAVELNEALQAITGMQDFTLLPAAGAHGEFTGLCLISAYYEARGELDRRRKILIPETAHGTNPASAALAGFEVVNLPPQRGAVLQPDEILPYLDDSVACLMLTNPNTLGVFESHIEAIAERLHELDAFLYCDGANLNAIMGKARPGDFGVDVIHLNLHKTMSTPHGGGGPGCGPVGVSERLVDFLPGPRPVRQGDGFSWATPAQAIEPVKQFYGHFGMFVRALAYIRRLGGEGLRRASERAVLNANYLRARLADTFELPFDDPSLHEVVFSDKRQKMHGVSALDIAKGLIDRGFHPPTIYFPLVVSGALMIEPTESEDQATLDQFVAAMIDIAEQAASGGADALHDAPTRSFRGRLDEATAARKPILRWTPADE